MAVPQRQGDGVTTGIHTDIFDDVALHGVELAVRGDAGVAPEPGTAILSRTAYRGVR
jgi:hypothetical protein